MGQLHKKWLRSERNAFRHENDLVTSRIELFSLRDTERSRFTHGTKFDRLSGFECSHSTRYAKIANI